MRNNQICHQNINHRWIMSEIFPKGWDRAITYNSPVMNVIERFIWRRDWICHKKTINEVCLPATSADRERVNVITNKSHRDIRSEGETNLSPIKLPMKNVTQRYSAEEEMNMPSETSLVKKSNIEIFNRGKEKAVTNTVPLKYITQWHSTEE